MEQELKKLRAIIDQVDEEVIALLARRFVATEQVGRLKAATGLAAVDKARELEQHKRYRRLASQHGLSPDLVVQVFRSVIDEVVANHRAWAGRAPH